jgi:hypothetical protein
VRLREMFKTMHVENTYSLVFGRGQTRKCMFERNHVDTVEEKI